MEEVRKTTIEKNGIGGFASYRVPGLTTTRSGRILLSYEGRDQEGSGRTLFLRHSEDGGTVFGARQAVVCPQNGELLHNPMLLSAPDGRVLFFWCQDYTRLFLRESDDEGETFGSARELTEAVEGFREVWPLTLWSLSPGHGIAMQDGTLVIPLWLSRGENVHLPACFVCLYSRDGGKTWLRSGIVPAGNGVGDPTEASVAERSDGTLLATMRHEIPGSRRRAFCHGGPEHWSAPWLHDQLPDPICSGALLRLADGRLAFVNCAYGDEPALECQRKGEAVRWSLDARRNLTVRLSGDDGTSWSKGLLLERESGASDLGQSPDGSLSCFYEQGWQDGNCIYNRSLVFARIPLSLLEERGEPGE